MPSQAQIDANRRNARKSTGPVTELGKGISKFNALKHGMTASNSVLPYEDPSAYAELHSALRDCYRPATTVECMLVETIANAYWRLLRCRRVETSSYRLSIKWLKEKNDLNPEPKDNDDDVLAVLFSREEGIQLKLDRYTVQVERCYFQAIETLRKVQKERLREERLTTAESKRIGFVSRGGQIPAPPPIRTAGNDSGMRITETPHETIFHIIHPDDRKGEPEQLPLVL